MLLTVIGTDGRPRCRWAAVTPEFPDYHDREWGWPVVDDRMLFEKMCVENFQSGLSWRTILAKRENFRSAFDGFDLREVANLDDNDIGRLLADEGIVRHRGKIEIVINNARRTCEVIQEEGSFAAIIGLYESAKDDALPQMRSKLPASETLSRDLRKLGFKFVGSTTVYAFIKAMGLIIDHAEGCWMRKELETAHNTHRTPT